MVESMDDDTKQEFEQLAFDPTITGPGTRTEDPYEPGTKLKIDGQRGTFVYRYATVSRAGLVSLHLTRDGVFRAVRPDQVTLLKKRGFRR
jgi:hypothetical protein